MSGSRARRSSFAGVLAGLSLLTAGCGGSKSPSVASLGTTTPSRAATSTTAGNGRSTASGNPANLLDGWAACMRTHGDPDQVDPTIDAHGAIHIAVAPDGNDRSFFSGFKKACQRFLTDAITALRGGKTFGKPDTSRLLTFSTCMRAHGIPDFPDPSRAGLVLDGAGDLDPNNPTFRDASEACAMKTGVQAFSGTPPPGALIVRP